jgi:hypothetical protein
MLTSHYTPASGLGASEDVHERGARSAMGQVRQRMASTIGAPSCGAKLNHMYWAFYSLGLAQAHVESLAGPMAYATQALLHVLKREVQTMWQGVRAECRL